MALINCKKCGHRISDKATDCVKCGELVEVIVNQQKPEPEEIQIAEPAEQIHHDIRAVKDSENEDINPASSNEGYLGSDGLYLYAPSRSFQESIGFCFKNYAKFSGRASRS